MNEITLKESIVSTAHRKFGELVAKKRFKEISPSYIDTPEYKRAI